MSRLRVISRFTILIGVVMLLVIAGQPVQATPTTTVVNLVVDTTDDILSLDDCTDAAYDCSLRGAIQYANLGDNSYAYHISIPAGNYYLITSAGSGEDANATGDLDLLSRTVILDGAGRSQTILDGANLDRVLDNCGSLSDLTVSHLQITNGLAPDGIYGGGGVLNRASAVLMMDDVWVNGNYVAGTDIGSNNGGGVSNYGKLIIDNSTIETNFACTGGGIFSHYGYVTITDSMIDLNQTSSTGTCGKGGGIWIDGSYQFELSHVQMDENQGPGNTGSYGGGLLYSGSATGTIRDSAFNANQAKNGAGIANMASLILERVTVSRNTIIGSGGYGAGIHNSPGSTLILVNVTISGNSGAYYGGGIFNNGNVSMDHCTIANNTAINHGYAYSHAGDDVNAIVHNTILSSTSTADTCFLGSTLFSSEDYNMSSDSGYNSCFLLGAHDLIGVSQAEWLGLLQDNGGPTETMALLWQSPSIDAGDPASTLIKDQRLAFRPKNGDLLWGDLHPGAVTDIGAYEFSSYPPEWFFWLPVIFMSILV